MKGGQEMEDGCEGALGRNFIMCTQAGGDQVRSGLGMGIAEEGLFG